MARLISETKPLKQPCATEPSVAPAHDPAHLRHGSSGFFVLLLVLPLLWACSGVTYVFHAAIGQIERSVEAVPIQDALKDPSLGDQELAHLEMIDPLKQFAVENLGLAPTESYTTVYLKPQSYIYTVSAAPKDRLSRVTWWFPVVGRVPYLGFFDLTQARAEGKSLAEEGMDVFISRAEAYSTLGWFNDPLTLNMIEASTVEFVETVIHEMTHSTLYLSSQPQFNETLASVVAKHGTILFLEAKFGVDHPWTIEARNELEDERTFSSFISSAIEKLEALYGASIPREEKIARRATVFSDAKRAFEHEKDHYMTNRFYWFSDMDLNNASILALALYHRYFNDLDAVLCENQGSIPETIAMFRRLSKTEPDLIKAIRK